MVLLAAAANADFHPGAALGGDRSPSTLLVSGDDDRAARCDEFINPRYADMPACTAPDRNPGAADAWTSSFDSGWGALAGLAAGYRFAERFRIELEADYGMPTRTRFTPFVAVGAGADFATMEYDVLWERTDNLDEVMYAGAGLPNEDERQVETDDTERLRVGLRLN